MIKRLIVIGIIILGLFSFAWGLEFKPLSPQEKAELDKCIDKTYKVLESKTELRFITGINGERIDLGLFERYEAHYKMWLPYKFYHWKSEIKEMESNTSHGKVKHKVRVYYNILSTCRPDMLGPEDFLGDVAEIYDEFNRFMGLVLNLGDGQYIPFPYDPYLKKLEEERQV